MTALNPVMTCGDQIDEVLSTHTELDAKPASACSDRSRRAAAGARAHDRVDLNQLSGGSAKGS
jgi:ABC-type microcin C transport system duplicated ATPase subunit YejF